MKKDKRLRNRSNAFRFKKGGKTFYNRFADKAAAQTASTEDGEFISAVFTYSAIAAAAAAAQPEAEAKSKRNLQQELECSNRKRMDEGGLRGAMSRGSIFDSLVSCMSGSMVWLYNTCDTEAERPGVGFTFIAAPEISISILGASMIHGGKSAISARRS
eukprot:CAMPEP_0119313032 /NCGR_PEP_ID=MMETSP1333-20130426/27615_1 /TAXON_ID=418940 /ORGANISM="Scyphosphaera apsteinii, Strain RCC1455" /LENGTH=158 /DNA_ID=CAMNT_0007317753 /DNA_START=179 /DNA_END=656 /DNA_ORIENTATION=+